MLYFNTFFTTKRVCNNCTIIVTLSFVPPIHYLLLNNITEDNIPFHIQSDIINTKL